MDIDYSRAIEIVKMDLKAFKEKQWREEIINRHCGILHTQYGFDSDFCNSFLQKYCNGKCSGFDDVDTFKSGLVKATDITDVGTLYVSYWRALTHWDMYTINEAKREVFVATLERLLELINEYNGKQ